LSIDNPELLAPLLDYADDLEMRDELGWTPLMTAVNRGSKQNVNMLLTRGAKVDCDYSGGMSLIADAMNFNDIGKINNLILINNIAFLLCIYLELIMILIDHGARVTPTDEMLANGQDQNSFYLLHYAVDDGLIDVAKILIEKGKIPLNTLDQAGWSPLHLAAGHNNLDMVVLLTGKGADVNIKVRKISFFFLL
jgi:ankyrin repeat protein